MTQDEKEKLAILADALGVDSDLDTIDLDIVVDAALADSGDEDEAYKLLEEQETKLEEATSAAVEFAAELAKAKKRVEEFEDTELDLTELAVAVAYEPEEDESFGDAELVAMAADMVLNAALLESAKLDEASGNAELDAVRIAKLKEALEEAAKDFDALAEAPKDPPAYVVFRQDGYATRGNVRLGMAASFEQGDYTALDLMKIAHVVTNEHGYAAATHRLGEMVRGVGKAAGATAAPRTASRAARKVRKAKGGKALRFGELKATGEAGRPSSAAASPQSGSQNTKAPKRSARPLRRTSALRSNARAQGSSV